MNELEGNPLERRRKNRQAELNFKIYLLCTLIIAIVAIVLSGYVNYALNQAQTKQLGQLQEQTPKYVQCLADLFRRGQTEIITDAQVKECIIQAQTKPTPTPSPTSDSQAGQPGQVGTATQGGTGGAGGTGTTGKTGPQGVPGPAGPPAPDQGLIPNNIPLLGGL